MLFERFLSCSAPSGVGRDDVVGVCFVGELGDDGAEGLVLCKELVIKIDIVDHELRQVSDG